jgi:hypothetical protein
VNNLLDHIEKRGDEYCVISHRTGKNLGCYGSKGEASRRLEKLKSYSEQEYAEAIEEAGVTKSEGDGPHPASHYLVREDPKKPSTWHLRVKNRSGKVDPKLVGAAWAALHKGYRGNRYGGPGKAKAVAKLRSLYRSMGRKPPGEESLFVGHFSGVLEARKLYFEQHGYSLTEAAALARLTLTKPVSNRVLEKNAAWLSEWMPAAEVMLESQWEELARKVSQYAEKNPTLFKDDTDAPNTFFQIQGVYPAIGINPALVIAHDLDSEGEYYAANWSESEDGDIEFSNVRDISTQYEMLVNRLHQNLSEALIIATEALEEAIDSEREYLTNRVLGRPVKLPALQLDGLRPVGEMELAKFYRNEGYLEEVELVGTMLPETEFTGSFTADKAVLQLAEALGRMKELRKRAARAQSSVIRPVIGQPMKVGGVKETQECFVSLIFEKKKFDATTAVNWLKLAEFRYEGVVEDSENIRVPQSACPCKKGTLRVVPVARGVSGTVCAQG